MKSKNIIKLQVFLRNCRFAQYFFSPFQLPFASLPPSYLLIYLDKWNSTQKSTICPTMLLNLFVFSSIRHTSWYLKYASKVIAVKELREQAFRNKASHIAREQNKTKQKIGTKFKIPLALIRCSLVQNAFFLPSYEIDCETVNANRTLVEFCASFIICFWFFI